MRQEFGVSFALLFKYTLALPSMSRWTAVVPVCAFLAAMTMVHNVLFFAFCVEFKTKVQHPCAVRRSSGVNYTLFGSGLFLAECF